MFNRKKIEALEKRLNLLETATDERIRQLQQATREQRDAQYKASTALDSLSDSVNLSLSELMSRTREHTSSIASGALQVNALGTDVKDLDARVASQGQRITAALDSITSLAATHDSLDADHEASARRIDTLVTETAILGHRFTDLDLLLRKTTDELTSRFSRETSRLDGVITGHSSALKPLIDKSKPRKKVTKCKKRK